MKNIWANLLSNNALKSKLWNEIETAYSSGVRYYHNLTHIQFMIDLAYKYQKKIDDFDTLLFSIFYHDIIYKATSKHNEEKSAQLAKKRLLELNFPKDKIQKCREQILATKHHESNGNNDINYLLDFDLAILGEDEETYRKYCDQIRKEYAIYPDWLYNPGRKKVIKHFLSMERIFKNDTFNQHRERQARLNLEEEFEIING